MPDMKVERSIEINATPEQAWEWLADVPNWPKWKPFIISSSYIKGKALEVGSKVQFKPSVGPAPINLKTTITESKPNRRLVWEGGFPGLKAVHSFDFEPAGDKKTRIITREAFTGFGVILFRLIVPQKDLEKLHDDWLQAFKNKADKKF